MDPGSFYRACCVSGPLFCDEGSKMKWFHIQLESSSTLIGRCLRSLTALSCNRMLQGRFASSAFLGFFLSLAAPHGACFLALSLFPIVYLHVCAFMFSAVC